MPKYRYVTAYAIIQLQRSPTIINATINFAIIGRNAFLAIPNTSHIENTMSFEKVIVQSSSTAALVTVSA